MEIIDTVKSLVRGTINLKRLRKDGLIYGANFNVQEGVIIDPGHCWLIEIGDNVTLAPRVHILAHDASMKKSLGYAKIGLVKIGNNVFIGAGTIVLPNVSIEDNTIIGAGSVVSHSITSGVYVGNPIRRIMDYEEWIKRHTAAIHAGPVFDESYKIGRITDDGKRKMKEQLKDGVGYIE